MLEIVITAYVEDGSTVEPVNNDHLYKAIDKLLFI